ncbi:MAG: exo-alpha-sialidase [Myxococcales bacterium]|nr:exo-alpha-sialidase [Myxococcales bacterium]
MDSLLYLGTKKGLFVLRRGENGRYIIQERAFLGDKVVYVHPDSRNGFVYAALDHGHFGVKLHRFQPDSGWKEITTPAFPPKPDGFVDKNPHTGQEVSWTVQLIWSLARGGADQPGVLWAGTIPGGLFRTADYGDSWQLVDSLWHHPTRQSWFGGGMDLPGIHSICVDPRDSRRVVIGISCAGVWLTEDSGQTWVTRAKGMRAAYMPPEQADQELVQDPHCIVQCPSAPTTYWCQHHNGIFKSTDGAENWVEITPAGVSAFGFAVAVHPQDPNVAWFVPAIKDEKRYPEGGRVIVSRTRDGGEHFDVLHRGLPQSDAYDLVYRHALAVDDDGQVLAFGSTTGSLWVSANQGDDWELVNAHFPPIFAVQFG